MRKACGLIPLLWLFCAGAASAQAESGAAQLDESYGACVLSCDAENVDYSTDMAGPGADMQGMRQHARRRYALCLYHCDPSLEHRPTLLRLFPPLGRLAETKRKALSTNDQLQLCVQDCDTSRRACEEANFSNAEICRSGGRACRSRCDEAFDLGQEGAGRDGG